jgi:hypothetical protein
MIKVRGSSKPIITVDRGGVDPKSLRGNRLYKGHIAEKASIQLKNLAILEIATIVEIFVKAPHF